MLNSLLLNIGRVTSQLIGSYKLPDEIVKRNEFDVSDKQRQMCCTCVTSQVLRHLVSK